MRILFLLLLFLPFLGISQSVKLNVFDNTIQKQRIELEPVVVYASSKSKTTVSFSAIGTNLYVQLSGVGWGASTIDENDKLVFRLANGNTVTAKSIGLQSFEPGVLRNTYHHQYFLTPSDVDVLSKSPLISIRKFSMKEPADVYIEDENRYKVQKLSLLFAGEIAKAKIFKTLRRINLRDIGKHIGDSVQICSKVFNTRYFEASENRPTVLDVQADYLDPVVKVIILEQDRQNFVDNPEKVYLNRDVCINGLVALHNNVPCIFLHNREQIKVKMPPTLQDINLFVGDTITVSGKVFTARYFPETPNQPTLLNIGAPFPDQLLTVVIEKAERNRFSQEPETFFLNKEISVTGQVILYKNKPEIVIKSKDQIKLLVNNAQRTMNVVTPNQNTTPTPAKYTTGQNVPDANANNLSAEFPGGEEAWLQFLNKNLQYPKDFHPEETKTVVASFYVETDGNISNIQIVQSAGKEYDKEVLRVLKKMPRWKFSNANSTAGMIATKSIVFKKNS